MPILVQIELQYIHLVDKWGKLKMPIAIWPAGSAAPMPRIYLYNWLKSS